MTTKFILQKQLIFSSNFSLLPTMTAPVYQTSGSSVAAPALSADQLWQVLILVKDCQY
jgi:hypothetical protein